MVHIAVANAKDEVALGHAVVTRMPFRQFVTVTLDIEADAGRVWALLTDAAGFPRWNSTVAGIDGRIAPGETLAVRVPGTAQVFRPTVTEFEPMQRMVWRGGFLPLFQGVRVFELLTIAPRRTRFTLSETFRGLILPLIARKLPDFAPIFEAYANDLKRAAEQPALRA